MDIIKSTGQTESFNKDKICDSLKKAGAPADIADKICLMTEKKITGGQSTEKIFRTAMGYLLKENLNFAANYSLRRAVGNLGPAGFLFEQYVEIILCAHEYETQRNVIVQGYCVEHEIDVSAKKDGIHYLIEAKYRNERGIKTHIDAVMYADARLMDIARLEESNGKEKEINSHTLWLFTNTKFTDKAIRYGKCRDIIMTGWNYPPKKTVEDLILAKKLYPITILPSLNKLALEKFAQKGLLLAQDILLYTAEELNLQFGVSLKEAQRMLSEVQTIVA